MVDKGESIVVICVGLDTVAKPYEKKKVPLGDLDMYMSESENYNKLFRNTYPGKQVTVDGHLATLDDNCFPVYHTTVDVSCPEEEPEPNAPCVFTERCEYGKDECCGVYPETTATCYDGHVMLMANDAC